MLKFLSRSWIIGLLICGLAIAVWAQGNLRAQGNEMSLDDAIRGYEAATHQTFQGVPDDWSTHHVVFSRPAPGSEAEYRVQQDPRYWLQQIKERMPEATATSLGGSESDFAPLKRWEKTPKKSKAKLKNDWSERLGSATAKVGAGQYPAKYSLSPNSTPSCTTDFVVFNTGVAGGSAQPSILAFNNLYPGASPGCGTTGVPAVYWAYNTGGTVVTAPALSLDGTQVAFIQSEGTIAYLVILKWAANTGTLTSPVVPTTYTVATASSYRGCTAPCMLTLEFNDTHNSTNSFPFYDYSGGDLLFAGDDSGYLHKFTGVFKGTPAEVTTTFPVEVTTSGEALTTPVYDSNTGLVFVGEAHTAGSTTDGKFHSVSSSTGAVLHSGPTAGTDHALCHGVGFKEGALLDPAAGANGTLYIGCDHDVGGDTCGNGNNACLRQFPEESISGGVGTAATLGAQADAEMFVGAFNYTYLISSAPTGTLYVCGNPASGATLYRIPITANVMGTPVVVNTLSTTSSSAGTECSPVTEFHNASTDWLFVSEPNAPALDTGTCSGTGCVYSFNISSTPVATATATPTAAMPSASGASGIIVDNGANQTGSSNVYFSTLGSQPCKTSGGTANGCAIQAAQSGLAN